MKRGRPKEQKTLLFSAARFCVVACFFLIVCPVGWSETESHEINGGFEKVDELTKYEDSYRRWTEQGVKLPEIWIKPYGWDPNCKDWIMKVISNEKAAHSGKNFLKVKGEICFSDDKWYVVKVRENDEITVKIWAKDPGRGKFKVQLYQYVFNEKGEAINKYDSPVLINEAAVPEWRQYTGKYVVPRQNPQVRKVNISLSGNGTLFDDVEVEIKRTEETDRK